METLILDPSRGMYVDVDYLVDLVNDRADVIRYNSRDQQDFQERLLEIHGDMLAEDGNKKLTRKVKREFLRKAEDLFYDEFK